MKKVISSFLLCFALFEVHGQVNLVPNPSFEERTGCPQGLPDMEGILHNWYSYNTPDYYHNCSSIVGYTNPFGYQQPHSGEGYVGITTYRENPPTPTAREFVGIELITPMEIGTKYYLTFYVSVANKNQMRLATNKMGALFTTNTYHYYSNAVLFPVPNPNFAHIYSNEVITDTINWIKISGAFVADSAYQHLVIGNFFDNNNTEAVQLTGSGGSAYYYLDDVCLSTDSLYTENWLTASLEQVKQNVIYVHPNPATDCIQLNSINEIELIILFDALGKEQFSINNLHKTETTFDIKLLNLNSGIYCLIVKTKTGVFLNKVIITQK